MSAANTPAPAPSRQDERSSARASSHSDSGRNTRLWICPVCWMREAAEPPNENTSAATTRTGDVPAAIAEEQDHAGAAGIEQHECQDVEQPRAWLWHQPGNDKMQRGKDQRLRIGDLWPAGKNVRRPERRLSGRERAREEGELRIELRGGVVGNFNGARQPRRGQRQEGYGVETKRPRQRKPLSLFRMSRHSPNPDPHPSLQRKRAARAARVNSPRPGYHTGCQAPSAPRQAVPRAVCGLPSM